MNRGDYSRINTHKPYKHYTGVIKQQGRVDLDADSIEDHDIAAHLSQSQTQDVIGPCGFPEIGGGFRFRYLYTGSTTVGSIDADVGLSPGRGYVDGILCELEATTVPIVRFLNVQLIQVPTLMADGREFRVGDWIEVFNENESDRSVQARIIEVNQGNRTLKINVGLTLSDFRFHPQLRRIISYTTQPDYPDPPGLDLKPGFRIDLLYLDVWQRHVTAIEEPDILEVALGGPDTTTRVKTVCQVKVLRDINPDAQNLGEQSCDDTIAGWPPRPSGGRLSTGVVPMSAAEDPCSVAPAGGYRGLENRLYRLEIHKAGAQGTAKFKWSRDNGSVVFAVEEFKPNNQDNQVKVKRLGQDQVLRLTKDDWVEVLDDHTEYRQDHTQDGEVTGTMAQIDDIDEVNRIVILDRALPVNAYSVDRHARIRRWDQNQKLNSLDNSGLMTTAPGPISLEDGIQVRFSGENFKVGDYWSFTARTGTGDVERLTDAPPQGVKHHYCRLALIGWTIGADGSGKWTITDFPFKDCRRMFSPLTEDTTNGISSWPTVARVEWDNDRPMLLEKFNDGLIVHFSEPIAPETLSQDTFIVTLEVGGEVRDSLGNPLGRLPLLVTGEVQASQNNMEYRFIPFPPIGPGPDALSRWLNADRFFENFQGGVRCRVVLKGNAILDDRTKQRPLDGETFAKLSGEEDPNIDKPFTDLIFPSGDGNKGGDFESWFYLMKPPLTLKLTFDPPSVLSGEQSTGTITLSYPVPQAVQFDLTTSPANVAGLGLATVPLLVTIPPGERSTSFIVDTSRPNPDWVLGITASAVIFGEEVSDTAELEVFA
jgi:hypothetical protein